MPNTFDADPNKGFVAFPMSIFELDLRPGAFRTLAELCRMANVDGQCWPSLAQLGVRLGRSRAAVSGYISELRSAGVLETETQKMANGYNYRLRYTVTFWRAWRKAMGKSDERSVKPIERPLRTKNHIHKKQLSPALAGCGQLISSWKECVGQAPYPEFARWPDQLTLDQTKLITSSPQVLPEIAISADIEQMLSDFLRRKRITIDGTELADAASALARERVTKTILIALSAHLLELWKPYWTKQPTTAQLLSAVRQLPAENSDCSQQKLLRTYLRRWEIHQKRLHFKPSTANVAE